MPLAGRFCESETEALTSPKFPLTWVQCQWCELVQVLEDVSDSVLYGQYRYGSSTVPGLVRHFEEYAKFLASRFGSAGVHVVEIGANDGVLLSRLPTAWRRVGIDPSDVARTQRSEDYELLNLPLTFDLAMEYPDRGKVDLVTSSNTMAHFTDLHGAFEAADILLRLGGELILEVHDLAATLDGGQWDTIYHEHKVEWSERSLRAVVGEVGFEPTFTQRRPLHGGLLRCGFKKTGTLVPITRPSDLHRESFQLLVDGYSRRRRSPVYAVLTAALHGDRRVAAYGASGRANVWMNQLPELDFEYVIDDSPLRNGRWLPSIAVPVYPSATLDTRPPDVCLITAWNYARDIIAKHPDFRGTWLQTFARDP
ncbi:MAG: methyltransferase domain-containing protein [Chloroflexota bacterium]